MKRKEKADPRWPEHPEMHRMMTVREVSAHLHVHPSTIYRLLKQRKIPAFHIGSDWRFDVHAIDRWCMEQQKAQRQ